MKALTIKDLSITEELDVKGMSAVRGGCYGGVKMPHPGSYKQPSTPSYPSSTTTTNVSIDQANNQFQSNATGNGSAVFGGGIFAFNNQQGFNSIG
ncbi:hypothetical protein D3870_05515 [Noviherbaspirillum cavernae]|uniref:Uncharacterized protein n=1 Tax=Noviherbaspirillum cavernae TaxID=2320862 RepID=A0A418WZP9_9BURK|nr:hypothetical protein [Noviherbaspirillum cavernae]RJG05545.1 hypothetical protein D3870_05515 [Noviherbaspirillum cavernae]